MDSFYENTEEIHTRNDLENDIAEQLIYTLL